MRKSKADANESVRDEREGKEIKRKTEGGEHEGQMGEKIHEGGGKTGEKERESWRKR